MGAAELTMDVRRFGDSVAVVDIKGEVTAACEPVLMSAYEAATSSPIRRTSIVIAGALIWFPPLNDPFMVVSAPS